jgi:hypothetical protein
MIPEVSKIYNYFDDGKIRESRRLSVIITEIIPFNEIDIPTLDAWKEETGECNWLFSDNTDYFIKGDLQLGDEIEKIVFVRTLDGGWFSMGWWGGRLDINGSLYAMCDSDPLGDSKN